jgi:hypothetical protein
MSTTIEKLTEDRLEEALSMLSIAFETEPMNAALAITSKDFRSLLEAYSSSMKAAISKGLCFMCLFCGKVIAAFITGDGAIPHDRFLWGALDVKFDTVKSIMNELYSTANFKPSVPSLHVIAVGVSEEARGKGLLNEAMVTLIDTAKKVLIYAF